MLMGTIIIVTCDIKYEAIFVANNNMDLFVWEDIWKPLFDPK